MHSHHDHVEGEASASAPEPTDLDAARALIAEEQQARMQACAAELEQVLQRHGMRLDVSPPQINIAPAQ